MLTPEERHAKLTDILNEHDRAFAALREANGAFDQAQASMQIMVEHMAHVVDAAASAFDAQRAASKAHSRAIDFALRANQAALKLFNDDR